MSEALLRRIQSLERQIAEMNKQVARIPIRFGGGNGAGASSAIIKAMTVVSTTTGYITCSFNGENYNVQNPNHKAAGSIEYIDGVEVTYSSVTKSTRTATVDSEAQDQVLTPDYYVGEVLFCLYTGGDTYQYVDLNVAGRQWAEDLT